MAKGELAEARKRLEQALVLRPEKGAYLLDLAELFLRLKEPTRALATCERALNAKSDSIDPGRRARLADQAEREIRDLAAAAATHLSDAQFEQRFGCTRPAFSTLPEWTRRQLLANEQAPVAGGASGESLRRKVELIRQELDIDKDVPMAKVVKEANAMLDEPGAGTLIEQVQALLVKLGEAAGGEEDKSSRLRVNMSLRTLLVTSSGSDRCDATQGQTEDPNKFSIRALSLASAEDAAHGLETALGLSDKSLLGNLLKSGLDAIQNEFLSSGNSEDADNFRYVYEGRARKTHIPEHVVSEIKRGMYHGGPIVEADFDTGHDDFTLDDFLQHDFCTIAELSREHVLALRLYTTSSYRRITLPLREHVTPHPFRMTVYYYVVHCRGDQEASCRRCPAASRRLPEGCRALAWHARHNPDQRVQGSRRGRALTDVNVTLEGGCATLRRQHVPARLPVHNEGDGQAWCIA